MFNLLLRMVDAPGREIVFVDLILRGVEVRTGVGMGVGV